MIQVIAKNIHHHLGSFAGDGFADAVAEKSQDLALDAGKVFEQIAEEGLHFDFFLGRVPGLSSM